MSTEAKELNPSEMLIREGERGKDAYWLMDGELVVTKKVDGYVKEVDRILPGEIVGLIPFLLNQEKRATTVTAVKKSKVKQLDQEMLEKVFSDLSPWTQSVILGFAKRLKNNC